MVKQESFGLQLLLHAVAYLAEHILFAAGSHTRVSKRELGAWRLDN
jgi:hypothetical protein